MGTDIMADCGPAETWQRFLEQGRFMLQRSTRTGRYLFYPRIAEPETGSTELEWVEASGRARVHSVTVIHPRAPDTPYAVALVDLAEGPRMMTAIEGCSPESVHIGMEVCAAIVSRTDGPAVIFRPADAAFERAS